MYLTNDVVLLPDEEMGRKAIELSKQQSEKFNNKIVLHKKNCMPYISLAMGAIEQSDLKEVTKILQDIASHFNVFQLTAQSYKSNEIPSVGTISEFTVEKTAELQFMIFQLK